MIYHEVEYKKPSKEIITDAAQAAAQKMVQLVTDCDDDNIAFKASQFILEQEHGKATQKVEQRNLNVNIYSPVDTDVLERYKRKLISELQQTKLEDKSEG